MQGVGKVKVFLHEFNLNIAVSKLIVEAGTGSHLVVGVGDVVDRNRLGTVGGTNPVAVGQVDADGSRGIAVTSQNGSGDDLGADAFHVFLLEAVVNGRVALEVLSVLADEFGTA